MKTVKTILKAIRSFIWKILSYIVINILWVFPVILVVLWFDYWYNSRIDLFTWWPLVRVSLMTWIVFIQIVAINEVFPSYFKKLKDIII